jgi:hypothetical protein
VTFPLARGLGTVWLMSIDTGSLDVAGAAAFEAAVLVRCTGVCGGGRTRALGGARVRATAGVATVTGAERAPGFESSPTVRLAEFNRPDAARRLVELVGPLVGDRPGPVDVHRYTAGNRHRYDIHRVVAPAGTLEVLDAAWRLGYGELCGHPGTPRPPRRMRHAMALASAAWRGALRVIGPTRSDAPGLRVPDLDTATVLVRAGRMLDLPVRMTTRPGGQLLLVLPAGAPRLRLQEVTEEVTLAA